MFTPDPPTYVMANSRGANQDKYQELAARQIAVRHIHAGRGGLDIRAVLRQLHAEGIRSVLAEGGTRVIRSLLAAVADDRATSPSAGHHLQQRPSSGWHPPGRCRKGARLHIQPVTILISDSPDRAAINR
jgi:hypothetical protein